MITRHGDFTQKQYIYKVYDKGFNHKRKHYITGDTYLDWEEEITGQNLSLGRIQIVTGEYSGSYEVWVYGIGSANEGLNNGCLLTSDPTRPANIKSSDLSFFRKHEDSGLVHIENYYIEVFGYKLVFDVDENTVEVFYGDESLASDTLSSDYDFIRMYEQDGTFYIDNSDDRETWVNFASREIEESDETTGSLKFFTYITAGGSGFGGYASLRDVRWLRHDFGFKGIIDKVTDDLQFTTHINTPASSTTVKINQNPLELPEYIKNGAFVDIYVNYWGYLAYSQQGTINDENDEPIKDENDSPIMGVFSEELTPEKDSWLRFSGYINSIENDYDAQTVTLGLISHGEELSNILVVPEQKIYIPVIRQQEQDAMDTITVGNYNRRQTFTIDRNQKISRIVAFMQGNVPTGDSVTIALGKGASTIATAIGAVGLGYGPAVFNFNNDVVLEAGEYWIQPISSAATIGWYYKNSDVYEGGSRQTLSGGVWSNTAADFWFSLDLFTYDIEKNLTGTSVAVVESVMDVLERNYSQITAGDIDGNGKNVNLYLKLNTAKDALEKIGQLMALGWWWAIDPGTNEYMLKAPPSVVDHTFYVGRDILTLKIKKDITNLVNDLYYVGGEINEAQNQLTIRTEDVESITKFRRGLTVKSDGRVYRYDTAQAFSDFEIANNKDEVITTDIEIQAKTYDIETIRVGDLVNIVNAGGERIKLQVAGVNYSPLKVKLSLSSVPPTLLRTIAATTRSLEQSLTNQANNAI